MKRNAQVRFDYPKPVELIQYILSIGAPGKSDLVLDSFAGSGTTAHAVLNLNKDGGERKFILVEMEDYAESITAQRVKRVVDGYGETDKKKIRTGGSFDYYTLGPRLFDEHYNLNEEVGVSKIREYVWYTETRMKMPLTPALSEGEGGTPKAPSDNANSARNDKRVKDSAYLLGVHEDTAYYFVYEKDRLTVLNHELLAQVKTQAGQYIIYADNCVLPQKFLEEHRIIFKKIPRDISRF